MWSPLAHYHRLMDVAVRRLSPRERTREDLYDLIRSAEDLTRTDLVELSGLTRSTVNHAVVRLLADGRVTETDAEAKGPGSGSGRPGTLLRAIATGAHIAGIDFGHNHVHVAIADALGRPVAEERVTMGVDLMATQALDAAAEILAVLQARHGITDLARLVAGVPGPLDSRTGLVCSPTALSGWVGLAPAAELERRMGIPVHAENDAFLGAYGERRRGAGRDFPDFLYVKVSHGIGASPVIAGEPYRGATGLAGEIGHTHLDGHTELCRCGNRGCLEAVISVDPIRRQIAHTHPAAEAEQVDLRTFDDPITERILSEAGRMLGSVLADLVNLLNPSALILGGELGSTGAPLIQGAEESLRRYAQPATAGALQVLPAALGMRAELTGALHMAASMAAADRRSLMPKSSARQPRADSAPV